MMEQVGILKVVYDEKTITENFKFREFVITTGEDTPYPQHVTFKAVHDGLTDMLDLYPGDKVRVFFNLKGRESKKDGQSKYFNSLDAWKIKKSNAE